MIERAPRRRAPHNSSQRPGHRRRSAPGRRRSRTIERIGRIGLLSAVFVVAIAGPAAADPAVPTNYSSTVRSVEPATDAVEVAVVGGDSFLQITATAGHEVTVLGYDNEPYLRIDADGTIEQNAKSPAVVMNQARYGRIDTTSTADATAPPVWQRIGGGGTYVFHDHRIHWMASGADPPQLAGASSGKVFDWTVPLLVDGRSTMVHGDLVLLDPPSIVPTVVLGTIALVIFAIAMRWRRRASAIILAAAALAATIVSFLDQQSIPAGAGRQFSLYFTPAVAFACAVAAAVFTRSKYAMVLRLAAAAILPLWFLRNLGVLDHAVLPGDLTPAVLRATVAVTIAAVLAYLAVDLAREARPPDTARTHAPPDPVRIPQDAPDSSPASR